MSNYKLGTTKVYEKVYNTLVFNSEKAANAFMEKNEDYGVLKVEGSNIHLAKLDDEGTKFSE